VRDRGVALCRAYVCLNQYGGASGFRPAVETDVPSFDIWCLEIERFAAARCDARSGDDTEAYEHYRALAQQFEQQRADQDRRDQDLMERLNREPGDSGLFGQENLEK
jgi:hypothetical protein